jgi:hypothetical protein
LFRKCYINDLHTTTCSGMLGHRSAHWRRRDQDAPRAQALASGRAEVRRRRVARRVEQAALPLVQGAPTEPIVHRAIVGAVVRYCSAGFAGEWIGERRG